jgi:hypothetical protein
MKRKKTSPSLQPQPQTSSAPASPASLRSILTGAETMAEILFEKTNNTKWDKYVLITGLPRSKEGKAVHIKQKELMDTTKPHLESESIGSYKCDSCEFYIKQDSQDWIQIKYKEKEDLGTTKASHMFFCPPCLLEILSLMAQRSVNEALAACDSARNKATAPPPKRKHKKN